MAMIKCPDCKSPISDTADRCPRCGCNFRPEYEQMQRLRRNIYDMEHDQSARPAEPSGGIGGCSIISIFLLIAAVAVVVCGFVLLNSGVGGNVFLGLLVIAGGGYAAFWGVGLVFGTIGADVNAKKRRQAEIASYDQRPARIADMKRRLAQLEAKFR